MMSLAYWLAHFFSALKKLKSIAIKAILFFKIYAHFFAERNYSRT